MDSTELCKKFKERLDSVIKSDEQITEVEMTEFDNVSDILNTCFRTVNYKNQYFYTNILNFYTFYLVVYQNNQTIG